MSILYTDNPKKGDWKQVPSILNDLQDPDLFIDDNGRHTCTGVQVIRILSGQKRSIKKNVFAPQKKHGNFLISMAKNMVGNAFGENHSDTVLGGYIEGPWMTKHNADTTCNMLPREPSIMCMAMVLI
jgi:hypothetical protein